MMAKTGTTQLWWMVDGPIARCTYISITLHQKDTKYYLLRNGEKNMTTVAEHTTTTAQCDPKQRLNMTWYVHRFCSDCIWTSYFLLLLGIVSIFYMIVIPSGSIITREVT
jgi:hypothetical protein